MELLKRYRFHLLLAAVFACGFMLGGLARPMPALAKVDLGDILEGAVKVGGVKLVVDNFGSDVNKFINKFMDNNDAATNASSKVVTIITPIGNKHIGAAQVVGPKEAVEKVGAVAQLETSFMDKLFRIKVLVPIEGTDANDINRVPGVGVSAVLDIKI
jgi:hypothetical protein